MLPFLKPRKIADVIIETRSKGIKQPENEENEADESLIKLAESIISAIHNKDAKSLANALNELKEEIAEEDAVQDEQQK